MDVIDLCDDEEEATIIAPEDPLASVADEEAMPVDAPEQSIQIVDVHSFGTPENSLETDSSSEVTPAKRSSRRKTIHQPINTNDQLEFTDMNQENIDDEFIDVSELPTKINAPRMALENSDKNDIMDRIKRVPNPNSEVLRRVAFLRVCVQFSLEKLGYKTFAFTRNCNLQNLKNQYLRDKKLKKMRKK